MPELKNIRHEKAVQSFLVNGQNQSAAYREAYPSSRKWKDKTVWEHASRLFSDSKVKARVQEVRDEISKKEIISKEDIISDLKIISEVTIRDYIKSFNTKSGTITWKNPRDWTPSMERACTGMKPTRNGLELTVYGVEYAYTRIAKMMGYDAAGWLKVDQTVTMKEQPLFPDVSTDDSNK